ncbi:MAG: ergothioneine biosynthesis protein EgtB, partial [Deltaproteobacteria bacterium]|nr:ergothioneine biosynthesis protein EgtB [Deltaproteobacteria bacterium]
MNIPIPALTQEGNFSRLSLLYQKIRSRSLDLTKPLEIEDFNLQAMPDVSPPKWHLAHTTWFFETLILNTLPQYQVFDPDFHYLFNSYYKGLGLYHPRTQRGLLSKPSLKKVQDYRQTVDQKILNALEKERFNTEALQLLELGLHHEEQHQELLLTDIQYNFFTNPLGPVYREDLRKPHNSQVTPLKKLNYTEGLYQIGHPDKGFSFDNEKPRHQIFLKGFSLANRLITNSEYLEFIQDKAYQQPKLWLAQAWDWIEKEKIEHPLYWQKRDGYFWQFTLEGWQALHLNTPVAFINFFEADAFARWAGSRLPTEAEWEVAASQEEINGNFLEKDYLIPLAPETNQGLSQIFGDTWEWTTSAYGPYPGFKTFAGAPQEYNGKFMINQMVLRGGSCFS